MIDLLIYNARIVRSAGVREGWVAVSNGHVASSGAGLPSQQILEAAREHVDAAGGFLFPGLIDTHVHFRDPGLTAKADMISEGRAALAGGVTTVFDMPNTVPSTTSIAAWKAKQELAVEKMCPVHFHPLLGVAPETVDELKTLDPGQMYAVKLFLGTTTGAMASPAGKMLDETFRICADLNLPIIVHAEDNDVIAENMRQAIAKYGSAEAIPTWMHPVIRSEEACLRSSAFAVEMAHRYGTRLHLAHVSTAREARELLQKGPCTSKLVTSETTPLYMDPVIAAAEEYSPLLKVNPAIKDGSNAAELRKALEDGLIDTIGTDHAPHLKHEKLLPGMTAVSGAPSIQFALPLMLEYLAPELIVEKMNLAPRQIFGVDGNDDFKDGSPADFSLVSAEANTVTDEAVLSKCAWTPFAGRTLQHRVKACWIGGKRRF